MLLDALFNAACLYNALFAIDFSKCFLFSYFVLVYWHIVCSFQVWFCIMHSAFNLLAFLILCTNIFYIWKGYVLSGEITLKR